VDGRVKEVVDRLLEGGEHQHALLHLSHPEAGDPEHLALVPAASGRRWGLGLGGDGHGTRAADAGRCKSDDSSLRYGDVLRGRFRVSCLRFRV
jgi:hypothetical protein